MNNKNLLAIILIGMLIFSCKQAEEKNQTVNSKIQHELIFPKGEKITNNNFIGDVWLQMQVAADSINQNSVGTVTFDPGARSNWHIHPNGQILLVLDGEGYYQEKGTKKRVLDKGDVVKCPAKIPHWHGKPEKPFIQVAITSKIADLPEWLEAVTDEEYKLQ